ncbi:hypothetical protein C1645_815219 [Glomus cerebriforme]|uniref:Uncharacterized protein n=1 Tax=Glomus cerebriforme TaxID=658196 RepID=A0A397TJ89_9GLOM|nr:hypothetical protein C1645_815219 [Glomus cerebriforme]
MDTNLNYTIQENEVVDPGKGGTKKRNKVKKKEKAAVIEKKYAYDNEKDWLWIEFIAVQFVLRLHVQTMIKDMGVTPQLEYVCKHLWIMYVNKFNGIDEIRTKNPQTTTESMDIDDDNNVDSSNTQEQEDDQDDIEVLFEIPPSSSDEDYGEFGDATTIAKKHNKSTGKSRHYEEIVNILRVQYILAILHLGCVWLRLPILIADINRWIHNNTLQFNSARKYLPNNIKLHLGSRINRFEPKYLITCKRLFDLEAKFLDFYKNKCGICFPEINAPPILYRYIRDLMLPVEFYVASKELAQLINLNLFYEYNLYYRPPTLLMAIVIIVTKMVYGLDEHRRFPGENDQFAKYFPSFESWIKALSDRKEAEFKKEVPSDVSDVKEWININPDQYIEFCADLLGGRDRMPRPPEGSKVSRHIEQEKKYAEIDERSNPFKTLNEKKIVQEIKSNKFESDLNLLLEQKRESIDFRRKGAPSLEKISPEEKLRMQIEKSELAENFRILKTGEGLDKVYENLTSARPIEEELKILFSTADFDRNEYNQSVLPKNIHPSIRLANININMEENDENIKLPNPLDILRHRYSTFLYKKPEDPKDSQSLFGEKYTAYQIPNSKTDYEKKVQLLGDYHEDYERVLIFASNMIGETTDELQNNIMKVEVDLLQAIKKEGL